MIKMYTRFDVFTSVKLFETFFMYAFLMAVNLCCLWGFLLDMLKFCASVITIVNVC